MLEVTGVNPTDATLKDFQREFKCKNLELGDCKGLQFPLTCSFPPCNQCSIENSGKLEIIHQIVTTTLKVLLYIRILFVI